MKKSKFLKKSLAMLLALMLVVANDSAQRVCCFN